MLFPLLTFLALLSLTGCLSDAPIDTKKISQIHFISLQTAEKNNNAFRQFSLSQRDNYSEVQLFLDIIQKTLSTGKTVNSNSLHLVPDNGFTVELADDSQTKQIYRLYFDFKDDQAFLQTTDHLFVLARNDFHQMIETGYFNMLFEKNYAPTVRFELNQERINHSTNGTWQYETYHHHFLSHTINQPTQQERVYQVTKPQTTLSYSFKDKQPDNMTVTVMAKDEIIYNRLNLTTANLPIPDSEGIYYYEVTATWSDPQKSYRSTLKYNFTLQVNFPPIIRYQKKLEPGDMAIIEVKNFDTQGQLECQTDLHFDTITFHTYKDKQLAFIPIMSRTEPGHYHLTIKGNAKTESFTKKETIIITPKKFNHQHLKMSSKKTGLRNQANYDELNRVFKEARSDSQSEKLWDAPFQMPVNGRISTDYGTIRYVNKATISSRHNAIDIANKKGTKIIAPANGIVTYNGFLEITGNTIIIDHGLGIFSQYYHLDKSFVEKDDYLLAGTEIGTVGQTGFSTGPHLHFAIYNHGVYINPWKFFDKDVLADY